MRALCTTEAQLHSSSCLSSTGITKHFPQFSTTGIRVTAMRLSEMIFPLFFPNQQSQLITLSESTQTHQPTQHESHPPFPQALGCMCGEVGREQVGSDWWRNPGPKTQLAGGPASRWPLAGSTLYHPATHPAGTSRQVTPAGGGKEREGGGDVQSVKFSGQIPGSSIWSHPAPLPLPMEEDYCTHTPYSVRVWGNLKKP